MADGDDQPLGDFFEGRNDATVADYTPIRTSLDNKTHTLLT